MSEIRVIIDGIECVGQAGDTILEIANKAGIYIPTLCHHQSVAKYVSRGSRKEPQADARLRHHRR